MTTVYDFSAQALDGTERSLRDYEGRVLLVVNTASACGFTPQYKGLQELYQDYAPRGFEVLGFPCNQFGQQEPGNAEEIASFCTLSFGVSFPMFGKIDVNGLSAHPLYNFMKSEKSGLIGSAIKWNFTKFLVDRQGRVVNRFAPTTKPQALRVEIEKLL